MNTPALKIHMQIIRRINCQITSIKNKSRINCIIQSGKDNIIFSSKTGNVYTVIIRCDTDCCNINYILSLYLKVLKGICLNSNIDYDINEINQILTNSIRIEGLNPIGNIGKTKWNNERNIGFQINYEVTMDSIFMAYINILNSNNNIIKTSLIFSIKCGVVIFDIIKAYIGIAKWDSNYKIKIYKPTKSLLIEMDLQDLQI